MKIIVLLSLVPVLFGCASKENKPKSESLNSSPVVMKANLGKTVTLIGYAVDRKGGAVLISEGKTVWMNNKHSWPDGYYKGGDKGKKLRVTGVLAQDHSLPVFVRKKGDPIVQGVPVPEGTDLKKASHRWVLKSASYKSMD